MAISTAGDRHQSTLICSRAPSSPSHKEVEMKPDPAGFETSMIYRKAGKPEKTWKKHHHEISVSNPDKTFAFSLFKEPLVMIS